MIHRITRALAVLATTACLALGSAKAQAYHMDTHYFLRFYLSLATCFTWEESHLIASADWGLDTNSDISAEMTPTKKSNKVQWHAFGHSDKRFRELWLRATDEPDLEHRLIKLGQFMHFLEDWESHAGYGVRLGHARDTFLGRDPDSLGYDIAKNHRMIQSALDHLLMTCKDLDRLKMDPDELLVLMMQRLMEDNLLEDLYEMSNPNWKRGRMGGLNAKGFRIISANKARIEELMLDHSDQFTNKNIPSDFFKEASGSIPPPLKIPVDQSGRIEFSLPPGTSIYDWANSRGEEADLTLRLENVRTFYSETNASNFIGWKLDATTKNI